MTVSKLQQARQAAWLAGDLSDEFEQARNDPTLLAPANLGHIVSLDDGTDELRTRILRRNTEGLRFPWGKVEEFVFAPKRSTLWSGATFSGKTQMLRQLMLHAARSGHKILFLSLEEEALEIRREFVYMAAHTRNPNPEFVDVFLHWSKNRIYLADTTDLITPEEALRIAVWCRRNIGVTHVVIDSLMRLDIGVADTDAQKAFGNLISRVVRDHDLHIHLVAHPRKTSEYRAEIDLYDIRGAQDLAAQADNVITLHRNHDKLDVMGPSNVLTVWKQRGEYNWIGNIGLNYHGVSRQFLASIGDDPMQFMDWDGYPAI